MEQNLSKKTRTESDLIGSREVPESALYGVQTLRGIENFRISKFHLNEYPLFIQALAITKMGAAVANRELDLLTEEQTDAILRACKEILEGKHHEQFPVDMIQGGAGTTTNMNINEVVANRALELMGHQRGEYQYCSPNDHVNRSQSTNDAYPTAIHIGLYYTHLKLVKHFEVLIEAFRKVAADYPEAELVIVGDGPELDNLRQQANDLQLADSIRFIGAVYAPKTLGAYMNESSIYVLAGMGGLSINDAMTYGMPVLCAVCDSTERDLVMEGKNGYFFKDGDADSLADRIREMFESPERCKEMGKESERMIREKINMETVSERYLKAFQEILRLTHLRDSGN